MLKKGSQTGDFNTNISHDFLKVILYSYLILKKMNERIIDSQYINKYT